MVCYFLCDILRLSLVYQDYKAESLVNTYVLIYHKAGASPVSSTSDVVIFYVFALHLFIMESRERPEAVFFSLPCSRHHASGICADHH